MTTILWQTTMQVVDAIEFFDMRSQNQAPNIRGLRLLSVSRISQSRSGQNQAPNFMTIKLNLKATNACTSRTHAISATPLNQICRQACQMQRQRQNARHWPA